MDKVNGFEKEIERKKIKPLTNVEQFIRMYSLKKEGNLLVKIFTEKRDKEVNEDLLELQRKIREYNIKKKEKELKQKILKIVRNIKKIIRRLKIIKR